MGGAFVAVADDSSAGWWNPAGLAAGPFLDAAIGGGVGERPGDAPSNRNRVLGFSLATPPFGFSVYRLQVTQIRRIDSTETGVGGREDRRTEASVGTLSATQIGGTVLRTLLDGVHVGTTLKYLRGTFRTGVDDGTSSNGELLDQGEALSGGDAADRGDLDVGILAVVGPVRLGAVARNLIESEFPGPVAGDVMTLSRQFRVGAAFDAEEAGGPPLMIALDADAASYDTERGRRRVVAVGAEHWMFARRVGIRAGFRVNTVGDRERTATVGGSVALRSGIYVDGHIVGGGSTSERGWGAAARVSF
jgi:hypothetical protein